MKDKPTLYLIVGLPGAGKTLRAKKIEQEQYALRLTPDEWIIYIYGHDLNRAQFDAVHDSIEALQWQTAKRVLELGCNVVLDWGFWSKAERTRCRKEAEGLGAIIRIEYLPGTIGELWSRISSRQESKKGTLEISWAELEEWAKIFEPPSQDELP